MILLLAAALNFASIDSAFVFKGNYQECYTALEAMLPKAETPKEKSEVYWRLAESALLLGQDSKDKNAASQYFTKGIELAAKAIEADPRNPNGYMWHCANTGRECEFKGLKVKLQAVGTMMQDLTTILDKMGKTGFSNAWHAMAEIYDNHPMKSNDDAIAYARAAVATIPAGEIRPGTYMLLARLLRKRGSTAQKRSAALESDIKAFSGSAASNIEKYAHFTGLKTASGTAPWSSTPLAQLSDAQEADAILAYAKKRYQNSKTKTYNDKAEYQALLKMIQ